MAIKQASTVVIIDEQTLSLQDICRALGLPTAKVIEMVEYGVVEPVRGSDAQDWEFSAQALKRTRIAMRLRRDLHMGLDGLDVALNLLEEVQYLRRRLQFFEENYPKL